MANTKGTSVINNPKGGGAQSGLGEKFSPDLFTGTGNFSVPIAVSPGRNGFQPDLSLSYSTGNGNGVFGMGWALSIPGVMRKTSKGIPVYNNQSDVFVLSGAEDLVPVKVENEVLQGNVSLEKTYYKPRTEGLFARIVRHKKSTGEHYWEVKSKDGLISWYGTPNSALNDLAVVANPEQRESVFAWKLTKTEDSFGNVIIYDYNRDLLIDADGRKYDQNYLSSIKYCQYPDAGGLKYLCEVRFIYETRQDAFSDYKAGFEIRTSKRCVKIETYTNAATLIKTKTFHLNYQTNLPLNGVSLLSSIAVEGHHDNDSEWMPPLEFNYSEFTPNHRELKEIKGPLPTMSLGDTGFELVDLTGDGIPDLLQLNGTSRYWTNKGNGEFSLPRTLNMAPGVQLGAPGVQMIDANGDGRTDLMVNNGNISGYYPGDFTGVWGQAGFRMYKNTPSFSFNDPEVQLIDLDGDGITDVLRNGKRFECFYNHPEKGFSKVKTTSKNFTDFSFDDPRIRFADMTGDGLQDIVLITSGRVQYWPNLGYGKFGNKVTMKNAPRFPEQFQPKQILIGDLDGDGQADIAFVESNRVTLYINQSGNAFSEPIKINNTPRVTDLNAIRIVDIMGNGLAGILWSYVTPVGNNNSKLIFLDLSRGNKAYMLQQMNNNMGSITRVSYGSSVYHYLRDNKKVETRWLTQLPFPVQVVNKVEVFDLLSGGKLCTEYNYHNGYWDGVEREFRGFAQVDAYDTESFENFNAPGLLHASNFPEQSNLNSYNQVPLTQFSPPTLTKSWFYIGPVGDGFSRWLEPDFSYQYWQDDEQVLKRPNDMLKLLNELPRRAKRDALRTLRGSLLRSELYALDGTDLQSKPYTISESLMSLRIEFNP